MRLPIYQRRSVISSAFECVSIVVVEKARPSVHSPYGLDVQVRSHVEVCFNFFSLIFIQSQLAQNTFSALW